ncbi:pentapeptide repeat-containing protein [Streptomyces viridochromogenes]|uniref:Pentapeptide repeat-containing protein n=1 Tax=Streptomyces viridochromogenes Tue57 TaxID=1160705 RepID=L8PJV0_STRVR|nr:pentapeptide repeat-containing protein [Streptomyces viridochromogenes]ELS56725.1 hypothetical protein STVIR_2296 [Streptomyces viridochromogenes Tue57]
MWETSVYGPLGWGLGAVSALVVFLVARAALRHAAARPPRPVSALADRLVRPRPRAAVRMHRAALAVRRRYAPSALPGRPERAARRDALVEAERAARALRAACAASLVILLLGLVPAAAVLAVWAVWLAWVPWALSPAEISATLIPFRDAMLSAAALGAATGLVCAGLVALTRDLRRITVRRPGPPVVPAAAALVAADDGLRTPPFRLARAVGELCGALEAYAEHGGHAPHHERWVDLTVHARAVGRALHEAEGAVWKDPDDALPRLVLLLGTVNDRIHDRRWLTLLDDADLPAAPTEPEAPASAGEPGTRPGRWSGVVQQAAVVLPAVAAVGALVFSTITVQQTNDNLRIAEQDTVANRFNTAAANLAHRSPNVRLAGLFLLERIIQDSPRDQTTILQLLCSYVRDHAPADPSRPAIGLRWEDVAEDVRQAVVIIDNYGDNGVSYDLSGVRLPGLTLLIDLGGFDFGGAQLPGADFMHANLSQADLTDADLRGADLRGANLSHAVLDGADLRGALLDGAVLTDVTYTSRTRWPEGFRIPRTAGLVDS